MQHYWKKEIEKRGGKVANSVIGNPVLCRKFLKLFGQYGLYFRLLKQQKNYRKQKINCTDTSKHPMLIREQCIGCCGWF